MKIFKYMLVVLCALTAGFTAITAAGKHPPEEIAKAKALAQSILGEAVEASQEQARYKSLGIKRLSSPEEIAAAKAEAERQGAAFMRERNVNLQDPEHTAMRELLVRNAMSSPAHHIGAGSLNRYDEKTERAIDEMAAVEAMNAANKIRKDRDQELLTGAPAAPPKDNRWIYQRHPKSAAAAAAIGLIGSVIGADYAWKAYKNKREEALFNRIKSWMKRNVYGESEGGAEEVAVSPAG